MRFKTCYCSIVLLTTALNAPSQTAVRPTDSNNPGTMVCAPSDSFRLRGTSQRLLSMMTALTKSDETWIKKYLEQEQKDLGSASEISRIEYRTRHLQVLMDKLLQQVQVSK